MRALGVALIGCLVGACATMQPTERLRFVILSEAQKEIVRVGVRDALKDPMSAQFAELLGGVNTKGVVTVCGHVNAKNSYGGYAGASPFLGVLDEHFFTVAVIGGAKTSSQAVYTLCERLGLKL